MAAFVPLFTLVQALHWLGFLLDELLFRGYKRVRVTEPVFVLGPPRSGTTFLHRVLAQDPRLTTFSTWEALFAPSVTQRRFWLALGAVDRRVGRPLGRLLAWLERRLLGGLDAVHATHLDAPEEDYLAFTPVMACFILVLPFPLAEPLWRLGRFDRDLEADRRARLMGYYRGILQRHLYVHGADKRLLSKNASFGGLAGSLLATFPDARILCCMRDPLESVPSQLSSIRPGVALFDSERAAADLGERLLDALAFHHENLLRVLAPLPPERRVFLPMSTLGADLAHTLRSAYRRLGLVMTPELAAVLEREEAAARRYATRHRYSLDALGLDAGAIRARFAAYYGPGGLGALAARDAARVVAPRTGPQPAAGEEVAPAVGEEAAPAPTAEVAPEGAAC
jgi:hypothetical protein